MYSEMTIRVRHANHRQQKQQEGFQYYCNWSVDIAQVIEQQTWFFALIVSTV